MLITSLTEVNEEGTEAAAATGILMKSASIRVPQKQIVINRPFLFFIKDHQTGLNLFSGRILYPEYQWKYNPHVIYSVLYNLNWSWTFAICLLILINQFVTIITNYVATFELSSLHGAPPVQAKCSSVLSEKNKSESMSSRWKFKFFWPWENLARS